MRRYFFTAFLFLCFFAANPLFVFAGSSDVVIAEALFDPVGTDTGLEYIVLKNTGIDPVNMSGWDLYPDGVGYFTLPDTNLPAGGSIKIILRQIGSSDESVLYHASASGNMSNSSGSAALFSGTAHSKDTIVAFVRYHKAGSTERKTWESTAASASLWTAGMYVDVGTLSEGNILKLSDTAQKRLPAGWEIAPSENVPQENSNDGDSNDINQADQALPPDSYAPIPTPPQKMRAYAGKDTTVVVGAPAAFTGYAEDINGEPLEGARFLWNFGDGSTGEGKSILHAYRFPGTYTVFMDSSAGIYSSSDDIKINAIASPLLITEIKPGSNGWIAVQNNSARQVDISGAELGVATVKPFYMPPKTLLAPWAEIVFDEQMLGFSVPNEGRIVLRYSNGFLIADASYVNISVLANESLNISNGGWKVAPATPGVKNRQIDIAPTAAPIDTTRNIVNIASGRPTVAAAENATTKDELAPTQQAAASVSDALPVFSVKKYLWLFIGAGAGIAGGAIFLALKRFVA